MLRKAKGWPTLIKIPTPHGVEKQELREAEILVAQPSRRLSNEQLIHIVRMLLLCRSSSERQIVGWHLYHGLKIGKVADKVDLPARRIEEIRDSLEQRVRVGVIRHESDRKLSKLIDRQRDSRGYVHD